MTSISNDNGQIKKGSTVNRNSLENIYFEWDYLDNYLYTIIIYDTDANNYINYLIVNIPGMNINQGYEIAEYELPSVEKNSTHKLIYSVYRQNKRINPKMKIISIRDIVGDMDRVGTVQFRVNQGRSRSRRLSWSEPLEIPGQTSSVNSNKDYEKITDNILIDYAISNSILVPEPYNRNKLLDLIYDEI